MHIIGEVEGRDCLIVDDLIDTAGTLVKGCRGPAEGWCNECARLCDARRAVRSGY